MPITRKVIESSTEDKIVIGMVMSAKFLRETLPIYNPDYLKNSFARIICAWCLDYYEAYEKAPREQIKHIFDIEKQTLEDADAKIVELFLVKLSKLYSEEQNVNEDYFIDTAIPYFKGRELEIRSERVQKLLAFGKIEEAEAELLQYKQIAKQTSEWYSPFDQKEVMDSFDDRSQSILHLPGQFGNFIGSLERGWLVSVVGGFKKGKTFLMDEIRTQALTERLKVAAISLEMKKSTRNKRFYKKLTSLPDKEGLVKFPCFDCKSNQEGSCDLKERENRHPLVNTDGEIPPYSPNIIYRPCVACRKLDRRPKEFELVTWYDSLEKKAFSMKEAIKANKQFSLMWGNNLRMRSHPRFSATLSDIRRELDQLVFLEEFVPDVIVIDYAGIIKPEKSFAKDYMALDAIWKGLSGLAEERHALVITGSQLERGSLRKDAGDADVAGLAGWIGQAADVDLEFVINQTPEEKSRGVARLNKLVDRNNEFNEKDTCYILQHFGTGQTVLDSEIVREY